MNKDRQGFRFFARKAELHLDQLDAATSMRDLGFTGKPI
ncbi:hypothetical protein SAMN05720354_12256 [Nitrosospira sp. Nsp1]|nr:hypothetical protein SAMN05720354_12256 [Nitrosospira sp. Nsp1]